MKERDVRDIAQGVFKDRRVWAPRLESALEWVIAERHKQTSFHKTDDLAVTGDLARGLEALVEEVGEFATAMQELRKARNDFTHLAAVEDNLRYELIQVAAVALAIWEGRTR